MTLPLLIETTCYVCGHSVRLTTLGSTTFWGPYDLDGRPSGPGRYSIGLEIEVCPHCHYCAPDISVGNVKARDQVETSKYRQIFEDKALPRHARYFVCHAVVLDANGAHGGSALAFLHAAWLCDDENKPQASGFRQDALGQLERCGSKADQLLTLDLLRRTGQCQKARYLAERLITAPTFAAYQPLITYQLELINAGDIDRHSFPPGAVDPTEKDRKWSEEELRKRGFL
jgi:hypothetical protein